MIDPEPQVFIPPRLPGLLFQGFLLLLLILAGAAAIWQVAYSPFGYPFLVSLVPIGLGFALIPILLYRIQSLRKSCYVLERDGIHIYWGLRQEVIPMNEVLLVRTKQDFGQHVPLPWLRWPGSLVGTQLLPNGTPVEFMASSVSGLVLIATPARIYAISPEDPDTFISAYRRIMEFGSLTPLPPLSLHPSFLLGRFWDDRPARLLLLAGAAASVLLLVWVSLIIPSRPEIVLHVDVSGTGLVPSTRLLLLPFLSTSFFGGDLLLGLYLYRRAEFLPASQEINTALAYLLWGSGALAPLLFLGAMFFILGIS